MLERVTIKEDKVHLSMKEIIGIFLGFFLFRMLVYWIYSSLSWGLQISSINIKQLNSYIYILIDIFCYIVIIKFYTKTTRSKLKLEVNNGVYVYLFLIMVFLGYVLLYDNTIDILVNKFCKNSWYNKVATEDLKRPVSYFIHCVIVAPIFEEIYNRGIILDSLLKNSKPFTSIFTSALLFAVGHFNMVQFPNAFFMGVILGVAYYKTQSLWPGILIHILNNFISTICFYFPNIYDYSKFSFIKLLIGILILIICVFMYINDNKIDIS